MNAIDISAICEPWGINMKDFKNLSERAYLLIAASGEKLILKVKGNCPSDRK